MGLLDGQIADIVHGSMSWLFQDATLKWVTGGAFDPDLDRDWETV